jgi:multiple sugar transport system substrate-binding protein
MEMEQEKNDGLFGKRMNRREFLKRGSIAAGAGILLSSGLTGRLFASKEEKAGAEGGEVAVVGATAMERAVNSARELAKKNPGAKLKVMVPTGSLGNMAPFGQKWEELTGVPVSFFEAGYGDDYANKVVQESVSKTGQFDVTPPPPHMIPTCVESRLALDLTDWVAKYDPELTGPNGVVAPLDKFGGNYKGRVYALDTDGDAWSLFLRKDYLENPKEQQGFKAKYGYELRKPETWKQLYDQVKYFHRPDDGFYGGIMLYASFYSKFAFLQTFCSKGHYYFNDRMEPTFNSKDGVEALRYLQDLSEFQYPGVWSMQWGETYKGMSDGLAYSTFAWPAFARYNNKPGNVAQGKLSYCVTPGWDVKGKICHATMLPYSWAFIVSRYSKYPEIAYLWAQYNQSPEISAKAVLEDGGYFDPFRYSHFKDPEVLAAYTPEFMEVLLASLQVSIPEVILVGGLEYMDLLDKEVQAGLRGLKTADKALSDAAERWEEVTERYGRDEQLAQWKWLKQYFPQSVHDAVARKG